MYTIIVAILLSHGMPSRTVTILGGQCTPAAAAQAGSIFRDDVARVGADVNQMTAYCGNVDQANGITIGCYMTSSTAHLRTYTCEM